MIIRQENKEKDAGSDVDHKTAENSPVPECSSKGQVTLPKGQKFVHFLYMGVQTAHRHSLDPNTMQSQFISEGLCSPGFLATATNDQTGTKSKRNRSEHSTHPLKPGENGWPGATHSFFNQSV